MTDRALTDFTIPVRVYIEDTDAGGIVFYANYLKYFERARTEYVRRLGFEMRSCLTDNISFVVHSVSLRYLKPARLDDLVHAGATLKKLGKTYFEFEQSIIDESGEPLVTGLVKVACVNFDDAKPRVLPDELSCLLAKSFNE